MDRSLLPVYQAERAKLPAGGVAHALLAAQQLMPKTSNPSRARNRSSHLKMMARKCVAHSQSANDRLSHLSDLLWQ